MTPVEFRGNLWRQKTRVPELPYGVFLVILRLAVLVELRLVTDRQTQTQAHGYYRRCIASRGKKIGMLHRKVRSGGRFCYRFLQMSPVLSVLKSSTRLVTAIVHIKIGAIYCHSRPIRGDAENAGLENAGLENAGTSCVWVAKCNIINVRGHVRVNFTAGRGHFWAISSVPLFTVKPM